MRRHSSSFLEPNAPYQTRRVAPVRQQFFDLEKAEANGTGVEDAVVQMVALVHHNQALQRRSDVLVTLLRQAKVEERDYLVRCREVPEDAEISHAAADLVAMGILECLQHKAPQQYLPPAMQNDQNSGRQVQEYIRGIANHKIYDLSVRLRGFELLPWAFGKDNKDRIKIFGMSHDDADTLSSYYEQIFDKQGGDADLQRRAFAFFKTPVIDHLSANRDHWMGSDRAVLNILEHPVQYAVPDVRQDAINLSYRYIKEKIPQKTCGETVRDREHGRVSKLEMQAEYLVRLSGLIEADYPVEAAYMQDEAVLSTQEYAVQQKLYALTHNQNDLTTHRRYEDAVHLMTNNAQLVLDEAQKCRQSKAAFAETHRNTGCLTIF